MSAAAVLVLASLAAQQPDVPAFVTRLDSLRAAHDIPGLSVAVLRDQQLLLAAGLGYADLARRISATAETPYNIASVAKPISAVVALRLVEDGVLDLDRPMAAYSDWKAFCQDFSEAPSIFARNLSCDPPVHALRHLLTHTATGTPGTGFSYNPVLYSWASRPIMTLTDTAFSALVDRLVLTPAGMSRSARKHRDLPLPEHLVRDLAPPHRVDSTGAIVRAPALSSQGDGAAGGIVSTVVDLAKFDVALDRGELIAREHVDAMMDEPPYDLGWYVQVHEGLTLVWHSGWWPEAYSALYLKIPELGLTFIALANSEGVWWGNPLDQAAVHRSAFAKVFLEAFVGGMD